MGQRHRSREIALQALYQLDITEAAPHEAVDLFFEHFESPADLRPFAELLIFGVCRHRAEIDRLIESVSANWRLQRMSIVDRNILRLAVYELLHCADIPPKVSINEAIDLGKKFGTADSGPFINGILDQIFLQLSGSSPAREQTAEEHLT
jgi:N utilization substance protein B